MKQTIEIEVPDGYKAVYNTDTQKVDIVRVGLPKTWEEFCKYNPIFEKDECFIGNYSEIKNVFSCNDRHPEYDRFILPNKETAEAFLALIQLIRLRDCYRQGWVPNWSNDEQLKYSVVTYSDKVSVDTYFAIKGVISFQSKEIRDKFMENFIDLIEQAKDLL